MHFGTFGNRGIGHAKGQLIPKGIVIVAIGIADGIGRAGGIRFFTVVYFIILHLRVLRGGYNAKFYAFFHTRFTTGKTPVFYI